MNFGTQPMHMLLYKQVCLNRPYYGYDYAYAYALMQICVDIP